MKYLYYMTKWPDRTRRAEILKETKMYYFLSNDVRIHKNTMSTGSGWHTTHYYEENDQWVRKYEESQIESIYLGLHKNILPEITNLETKKKIIKALEFLE